MKLHELWVNKVHVKKHPPAGLFADGSAKEIAAWVKQEHSSLQSAISSVTFYINRAGSQLSAEQHRKLKRVEELLHKMY